MALTRLNLSRAFPFSESEVRPFSWLQGRGRWVHVLLLGLVSLSPATPSPPLRALLVVCWFSVTSSLPLPRLTAPSTQQQLFAFGSRFK